MASSLRQNECDNRDISSILEGLWRVTDKLIKMVQYYGKPDYQASATVISDVK
jgi:hypothetical protein